MENVDFCVHFLNGTVIFKIVCLTYTSIYIYIYIYIYILVWSYGHMCMNIPIFQLTTRTHMKH